LLEYKNNVGRKQAYLYRYHRPQDLKKIRRSRVVATTRGKSSRLRQTTKFEPR